MEDSNRFLTQPAAEVLADIEEWLKQIEDPESRCIVRLRMDGKSWREIPKEIGRRGDGTTERKKYLKLFEY